jgi:putative endonuclease
MEYVVYVLKSLSANKHYVGFTQSIISRFKSHNELSKKGFTARYRPWIMIWNEFYATKQEALGREKFLKSGQGRKWMKTNIIGY